MHVVNILLWLAVLGATVMPIDTSSVREAAIAGLVVAVLWQQATVRGVWRTKSKSRLAAG